MAYNPFGPVPVNTGAGLSALGDTLQTNAKRSAIDKIMAGSGGDTEAAIKGLMSAGFVNEAAKVAQTRPPVSTQGLTPYQAESLSIQRQRLNQEPPSVAFRRELEQQKRYEKGSQGKLSVDAAVSNLERLQDQVRLLRDHPGLTSITGQYTLHGFPTGLPAKDVYNIPGGDAANAQAQLETLKSQVGLNVLQSLRDASKTGGAVGQVSNYEQQIFQNNLAALDQAQSPEEFKKALDRIIDYADKAKSRISGAYERQYGGNEQGQPQQFQDGQTATNPQTGEKIMFQGGQWVPVQ